MKPQSKDASEMPPGICCRVDPALSRHCQLFLRPTMEDRMLQRMSECKANNISQETEISRNKHYCCPEQTCFRDYGNIWATIAPHSLRMITTEIMHSTPNKKCVCRIAVRNAKKRVCRTAVCNRQ